MSEAYFEDHPTDPNKVILRKKPYLDKGADYEHGFIDGMQYQMQSSVDRAVNSLTKTSLNPYRNMVIEEVAQEIEKFKRAFGEDTTQSFAAFVRNLKDLK